MSGKSLAIDLRNLFLRFGATAYVFSTIFPYLSNPDANVTGSWAMRWGLIILIGFIAVLFFVIEKKYFFQYCFIIVLFAALFNLFQSITSEFPLQTIFDDIFAVSVCYYMLTRKLKKSHSSSQSSSSSTSRSTKHHHHTEE